MAYDLQARFQRLRTATSGSAPSSPTPQGLLTRGSEDNGTLGQLHGEGIDVIGRVSLSRKYPLSIRAADTETRWTAFEEQENHASTPPINVPAASGHDDLQPFLKDGLVHDSHYHEPSPLEEFIRNRRPSITFHPHVTLESGQQRGLNEPLSKLAIDTSLKKTSRLQELLRQSPRSPLSRAFSDAEIVNYDAFTSQPFKGQSQQDRPQFKTRQAENLSRFPLLRSPTYRRASDNEQPSLEQGVSLTSASTASLIRSEIQTPPDSTMDCLVSPISSFSPFYHPTSLEESSKWPTIPRRGSAPRAKSYSFNRKDNVRQSSRRSIASSMSPATAFLSKFAREDPVAEPDDEGQEVGEYVLGKKIAHGGFSVVKEAYTIESGERVCRAVKIVRKHVTGKEDMENEHFQAEFEREVGLWRCLDHRHILPLIAVHVTNYATFCFTKLHTGGTLFDMVRANRQGLSRDRARRYTYQLASAIRYLHEDMRIVHRDIKLENCLIDLSPPNASIEGGNLVLCDFGLAEFVVTDDHSRHSPDPYADAAHHPAARTTDSTASSTYITGSLQYASPELIRSPAGFLNRAVDVWAYGVVVFALLVGALPFQHVFQPRVQMMILAGEWSHESLQCAARARGSESEVLELVHGCLDMNSESRWTIRQVLDSRWLNGCEEMLEEISLEGWKL